ncbi:putative SAM-dependent methyltransferase [Paratrimastix pyriformis]|uniref:SAM-dependent methyltransferase n=1 Tax=Paratrimastix pyriformis TaxID=342808 RepID=A0ABQ8UFV0_9EUKA|nr:putative SAM-dependent methyltransferase [Paratrimastix pyriformis]
MQAPAELNTLAKTGQYIAACRALESEKPDGVRHFNDPYARAFAGDFGFKFLDSLVGVDPSVTLDSLVIFVAARTKFLDDIVVEKAKSIKQIVIAACGGDSRARRLAIPPDCTVFELDQPQVIAFREHIFAHGPAAPAGPRPTIRPCGCDFSEPTWPRLLTEAGFDPALPSLWIIEGLVMYLTLPQTTRFFSTTARLCAPGSYIAGDVVDSNMNRANPLARPTIDRWTQYGSSPVPGVDWPENLLALCGFRVSVGEAGSRPGLGSDLIPSSLTDFFLKQYPRTAAPPLEARHYALFADHSDRFGSPDEAPSELRSVLWSQKTTENLDKIFIGEIPIESIDPLLFCNVLPRNLFFEGSRPVSPLESGLNHPALQSQYKKLQALEASVHERRVRDQQLTPAALWARRDQECEPGVIPAHRLAQVFGGPSGGSRGKAQPGKVRQSPTKQQPQGSLRASPRQWIVDTSSSSSSSDDEGDGVCHAGGENAATTRGHQSTSLATTSRPSRSADDGPSSATPLPTRPALLSRGARSRIAVRTQARPATPPSEPHKSTLESSAFLQRLLRRYRKPLRPEGHGGRDGEGSGSGSGSGSDSSEYEVVDERDSTVLGTPSLAPPSPAARVPVIISPDRPLSSPAARPLTDALTMPPPAAAATLALARSFTTASLLSPSAAPHAHHPLPRPAIGITRLGRWVGLVAHAPVTRTIAPLPSPAGPRRSPFLPPTALEAPPPALSPGPRSPFGTAAGGHPSHRPGLAWDSLDTHRPPPLTLPLSPLTPEGAVSVWASVPISPAESSLTSTPYRRPPHIRFADPPSQLRDDGALRLSALQTGPGRGGAAGVNLSPYSPSGVHAPPMTPTGVHSAIRRRRHVGHAAALAQLRDTRRVDHLQRSLMRLATAPPAAVALTRAGLGGDD